MIIKKTKCDHCGREWDICQTVQLRKIRYDVGPFPEMVIEDTIVLERFDFCNYQCALNWLEKHKDAPAFNAS